MEQVIEIVYTGKYDRHCLNMNIMMEIVYSGTADRDCLHRNRML